ncbi:dehydrogenase [Mycena galericulata]|nr:dehydrogenase [Mycena galericulata]
MTLPNFPEVSTYRWSATDAPQLLSVHNPATGAVITQVVPGNAATAAAAVAASQQAFESWRWVPPSRRAELLMQCAAALESHAEELARILCLENGKPYQDALSFDVAFLYGVFRYFGSLVDKLPSEFYDRGSTYTAVLREPFGVCVGILPFNWPPIHCGGKLAPALAAGNTMILKPGEQAPLTVLRIVEILQGVLPPDVVMAVPGDGPEVPQALVGHRLVRAVSFTGSTRAGASVAATAAATITPTVMELGGKNAFVVFADADLDRAVAAALEGGFFNKGEACTAASRVLLHESVHDTFVEKLAAGVKKLVTGDGMDQRTHVGPCVSKASQERVLEYIEVGKREGATVAAQGALPVDLKSRDGFFVAPTLFTGVTRDMTIAQVEIFGPVISVLKFSSEDEAVEVVNESPYGLTAIIFSKDSERCLRVSRRLDVGMVWVNNYFRSVLGTPFGGAKDSGHGREHCIETLRDWTRAKSINQPSGLGEIPQWRGVKDVLA